MAVADGWRLRILAVVDDYARDCLALVADTSISGVRVARELDRILAVRGRPGGIVSDNGTELTSTAILASDRQKIAGHYIAPGKPVQNAFIESFNGRLHTGRGQRLDPARFAAPLAELRREARRDAAEINRGRGGDRGPNKFLQATGPPAISPP